MRVSLTIEMRHFYFTTSMATAKNRILFLEFVEQYMNLEDRSILEDNPHRVKALMKSVQSKFNSGFTIYASSSGSVRPILLKNSIFLRDKKLAGP